MPSFADAAVHVVGELLVPSGGKPVHRSIERVRCVFVTPDKRQKGQIGSKANSCEAAHFGHSTIFRVVRIKPQGVLQVANHEAMIDRVKDATYEKGLTVNARKFFLPLGELIQEVIADWEDEAYYIGVFPKFR